MKILEFLALNWSSVLLVLALLTVLVILYVRGEKKLFNHILYALVTEAEAQYGGKTGELKKAAVIANVYGILPAVLKLIISEKRLTQWIEDALQYAKKKWAENADINYYINGYAPEENDDAEPP